MAPRLGNDVIPKGTSVTLVEPRYPVNVGHVARLVENFGVRRLLLVNPKVDMSVASVYASHASGVLDNAEIVSFQQVRKEHELLVATTAIRARKKSNVIRRSLSPEKLPGVLAKSRTSSLIFGRDSTGLTNEELTACDVTVTVDVGTSYRSLNLGHAVAIVLYLASRTSRKKERGQSRAAREVFARKFSDLAVASEVHSHRLTSVFEVAKRIASSSKLSDGQLNLMSGVFDKAAEALDKGQSGDSKT